MQDLNVFLFQVLNGLSANDMIARIAPILADFPIFFLPLFLVTMWLYYSFIEKSNSRKEQLLLLFYSSVVALILSLIVQQFIHLERPETAIVGAGKILLKHIPDASFPSDHASVITAFLVGLFLFGYKKVSWGFLPWCILLYFSRIIVGVHWPFDILAGIIVGCLGAFISFFGLSQIKFVKMFNSFIIRVLHYIKL